MAGPEQRRWLWQTVALLLAAVALCLLVLAVLASPLPGGYRHLFSETALVLGGLLVGFAGFVRARRTSDRRRRRAWFLLSAGGPVAAAANTLALVLPGDDGPAVDVGLLIATSLGVAGMLTFPSATHHRLRLTQLVFDGIVVGGASLFVVTALTLPADQARPALGADVAVLVLPLLDSLVATVAVLLVVRSSRGDRWRLSLLTAGFLAYAFSDVNVLVARAHGEPYVFGTVSDLGWIAGYVLLAVCPTLPDRPREDEDDERRRRADPVLGTVLIFLFFIGAGMLIVATGGFQQLSWLSRAIWLCTLVAVAVRQVLLIVDNERLRSQLVALLGERTSELRAVTRQTGLMVDSVDDGIYVVDDEGVVTFANPAAERLLGHAPGALLGAHAHDLFHAPRPDGRPYPAEGCYITEAIGQGLVTTAEEDVYLRSDGRPVPVEVTASPLRDEDGIHGSVVVFRDVTERQQVDRMKSEFVSVVSHELRTPLTSIRGSLGLLAGGAMGGLEPRAERMVSVALASSERLSRLIEDILDVERLESGNMPLHTAQHEASALVADALEQTQLLAAEADVELRTGPVSGTVVGDADRIVQTLLNLVGNALKYAPVGSPVTVSAEPDGAHVRFSVSDHGRGIPPDMVEKVFLRFQQVDSSDSREKGGTGLGLAISRSIVETMGGRIWVESQPGRLTTFHFTVPRTARNAHRDEDEHTDRLRDEDEAELRIGDHRTP